MADRLHYATILASVFSPDDRYYVVGNTYGDVSVYNLDGINKTSAAKGVENTKVRSRFKTHDELQVCSMVSTSNFLIIGTVGEITGWDWDCILKANARMEWLISVGAAKSLADKVEINSLVINEGAGGGSSGTILFAGCGDNNIYAYSLEDGKPIRTYKGHDDYIHSIFTLGKNLISGSEDGSVKMWDSRAAKCSCTIYPYRQENAHRSMIGKWVGAVTMNDNWLLCGGGSRLSLWHLRMLSLGKVFTSVEDRGIHVVQLEGDKIFSGGCAPFFSICTYSDELCSKIQTTSSTVYTCSYSKGRDLLFLAGSSRKIDVSTNLKFRDVLLELK